MTLPPGADRAAIQRAVEGLLAACGLSAADEPDLERTPARVASLYAEVLAGHDPAGEPELATFPHAGEGDLVLLRDVPFHSLCVHHLVPFFGRALIAYLPGDRIIGLSGMARLLERYARRVQLQERLGQQVADHLERLVAPRGLAVILEARHLCMEMRGIRKPGTVETRIIRGALGEPRWADALRLSREP